MLCSPSGSFESSFSDVGLAFGSGFHVQCYLFQKEKTEELADLHLQRVAFWWTYMIHTPWQPFQIDLRLRSFD